MSREDTVEENGPEQPTSEDVESNSPEAHDQKKDLRPLTHDEVNKMMEQVRAENAKINGQNAYLKSHNQELRVKNEELRSRYGELHEDYTTLSETVDEHRNETKGLLGQKAKRSDLIHEELLAWRTYFMTIENAYKYWNKRPINMMWVGITVIAVAVVAMLTLNKEYGLAVRDGLSTWQGQAILIVLSLFVLIAIYSMNRRRKGKFE